MFAHQIPGLGLYTRLFGSSPTPKKEEKKSDTPAPSFASRVTNKAFSQLAFSLAFLQQLVSVDAVVWKMAEKATEAGLDAAAEASRTLYVKEKLSDILCSLGFNPAEFPNMIENILKGGRMDVSQISTAIYDHVANLQCVSADGVLGPIVDVGVEMGQFITQSLKDLLDAAIRKGCDEYFDSQSHQPKLSSATEFAILGAVIGLVALAACVTGCRARRRYYHNADLGVPLVLAMDPMAPRIVPVETQPSYYPYSAPLMQNPMTPPVIVVETQPSHHHHHDDHDDHRSHSSHSGGSSVRWGM